MCSGHIPHHKCCSVYVCSRVQIEIHITLLNTTLNVFTPHIIPSHHLSRHTTPPLHNIPHHITTYRMFHATFNVATHLTSDHHILSVSDITPQSASHHHFTPPHIKAQHSTSHSPHPQLYHTTLTFSISQHISHHTIFHITPPHLTSQHVAAFST